MPPPRPARPWLAALLSIPMPGAGLFYAEQRRAGLWVASATLALVAVTVAVRLVPVSVASVAAFLAFGTLSVLVTVAAVIAGYIQARRARRNGRPRSSWGPVLALVAAGIAAGNISLDLPKWLGRPFYNLWVPSASMTPSLPVGMRFFASGAIAPARGSVVLIRPTPGKDEQWVKRVVAVGGDSVRMQAGRLYVNDTPAAPDDPAHETLDGHAYQVVPMPARGFAGASDMPQQTVPYNQVFVLGDNRPDSMDSRFPQVGTVPLDRVDAVGGVAYWIPGEGLRLHPLP